MSEMPKSRNGRPYAAHDNGLRGRKLSPERCAAISAGLRARNGTLEERFWRCVQKDPGDGCWHWTGSKDSRPYGQVLMSCVGGKRVRKVAHRVSWEDIHGLAVPKGLVLDHICKNTLCVRPDHLRPVTQADNCTVLARPTPFMANKAKTECKYGHPFVEGNFVWMKRPTDGSPNRACIKCRPYHANSIYRVDPPGSGGHE